MAQLWGVEIDSSSYTRRNVFVPYFSDNYNLKFRARINSKEIGYIYY